MIVMCLIKLLICFTTSLLDRILFVTLYLSFYLLICLKGLMRFVQVFQVTGIYVPSSSQVSDLAWSLYFPLIFSTKPVMTTRSHNIQYVSSRFSFPKAINIKLDDVE